MPSILIEDLKMKNKKDLYLSLAMLSSFVIWTLLVIFVDVSDIGPLGSSVGLARVNSLFRDLFGVNFTLYIITDYLGIVPIVIAAFFGFLGLGEWIKRKNIKKVDRDILLLGGLYFATVAAFLLFECLEINYRPVLIDGHLEASYPSSTTLLTLCVMPSAAMQVRRRIKNLFAQRFLCVLITVFTAFTVVFRILSGVHWFSDIVGGVLLAAGLVLAYRFFSRSNGE